MEKPIKLLRKLCLAFLFMASVFTTSAADFMVDSICYNIIGENEVEVTSRGSSNRYKGIVAIPPTVEQDGKTYHVTRIGNDAFSACSGLTLVDLPEGITSIGVYAFYNCKGLEAVEFPSSLVSIEKLAFYSCTKLSTLNITRNLTDITWGVFNDCTGLMSITCSPFNPLYRAEDGILYTKDMTGLMLYPKGALATHFIVPESVTSLQPYCFQNCDNLVEVNIHDGVTWLGRDVFWRCDGIESMDLPDGITYMGKGAFSSCNKLSHIHLPANIDTLDDAFSECPMLREIVIPRNVRYIGQYTFYESTGLESVIVEEGSCLETIDAMAFAYCSSLKSFDMPNSVKTVNYDAFMKCTSLETIHLSDNLVNLANVVFWDCSSLKELDIPNSVVSIRNGLVSGCSSMKRLKIGDKYGIPGTTTVEHSAIDCGSLEVIQLGSNIDSIPEFGLGAITGIKVFISWNPNPPKCVNYSIGFNTPFNTAVLYVPKASVEAYSAANEWKKFKTIVAIEDVGDVNADGVINISDAIALISHLSVDAPVNVPLADVNLDGYINISDVTALINRLISE